MNYIKFKNGKQQGKAFGLTQAQLQLTTEQLHNLDIYQCKLINENFDTMLYQLIDVKSSIAGDVVTLENVIVERSVEAIQRDIYRQLTTLRDFMLFGDIVSDGMTITVRDERDIQVVTNMGDLPVRFKRGTGDRISLTAAQAMDFRLVYEAKVQTAFDWEESEEDKVGALLTHDELKAYLESN